MEVTRKHDYEMHFNLESFMETLQTLDLEHWKVKPSKEREILDEVMKVVELERKRRTYIYELRDNITGAVTPSDYTSQVQLMIKRNNQVHLPPYQVQLHAKSNSQNKWK